MSTRILATAIQGPTDWNDKWKVYSSVSDYADELAEGETAPHAICLAALGL